MRWRELLAHRAFRDFQALWSGQISSQLGDRLTQMILIAIVSARVPGSPAALAKMMAFTVIPAFVVSPFAGAYVDRWDRRRTMLVCDLARGACAFALPAVAAWPQLAPTYGVVFLLFGIACFFLPARLALVPSLVPPEALVAANALVTTSGMIGATASMLVGGLLVEQIGVPASGFMAATSYLASAGCILRIRARLPPAAPAAKRRALLAEIREGLQYTVGQRHARFVLWILALLMGAAGAVFVVATVMVQQAFGSVTRDLGIFSMTFGLGLFLGTILYGRLGQRWRKPQLVRWCLVISGLSLLGLGWGVGVLRSWQAGCITTALLGMAVAPVGIAVNAMIHELVHDRLRGRVFSAMGIAMNVALLTGLWVAGTVAESITPLGTLAVVGGSLIAVGVAGFLRRPQSSRS